MSSSQQLKLWGHRGPNPEKTATILEELGLDYDTITVDFADIKKPEYLAVNPNGRLPTLDDPNTGIRIWESGAIIEYLMEQYDSERRLSFPPRTPEAYHARQWLYFQATGQGPYFGQFFWFSLMHPEKIRSAVERYAKEVNRVTGVLEAHLQQEKNKYSTGDGPWLVGNKLSYADLSFVPWQRGAGSVASKEQYDIDKFPLVKEWLEKMISRPSVQTASARMKPAGA